MASLTSLIFSYIFLLTTSTLASTQFFSEPELGVFLGSYKKDRTKTVAGLHAGLSFGLQWQNSQAGLELNARPFQSDESGSTYHLTNFPIGLTYRHTAAEKWRLIISWYWDDVLYKDFRFKFMDGLKIPKDYNVAYEGPGSWRFGASYAIDENIYLNQTLLSQKYSRYKVRRPSPEIGDVTPPIQTLSYNLTISVLY